MQTKFEALVATLEAEGMSTSDAQGAAEVQLAQANAMSMLAALRLIWGRPNASSYLRAGDAEFIRKAWQNAEGMLP